MLDTTGQGSLRTKDGRELPLHQTSVRASLNGPIASVEVRQSFSNSLSEPIEAVYVFPLPHGASVHRMQFTIAGRVVRAVVKSKQQARADYESALAQGRAASLLEEDAPEVFTLSVANVPPAATIDVELGYQELLGYDDGEWRFVFPMVAPERYVAQAPADNVSVPAAVGAPRLPSGERAGDVDLEIEIAGNPEELRCATHHVDIETDVAARSTRLRLSKSDAVANRDLVLTYRAAAAGVRPRILFGRDRGKDGHLLLVLTPPPALDKTQSAGGKSDLKALQCGNCGGPVTDWSAMKEIPGLGMVVRCQFCGAILAPSTEGATVRAVRPRDVLILVDRSASMRGALFSVRRAVRALLESLAPSDAVQVVAFDHERTPFEGEIARYMALSPEVISRIDAFLAELTPRGGTELEVMLERVRQLPVREGRSASVVLVSDCAVGNEGRLLRRAPELLLGRRLFVLGLGSVVDRRLGAKLARLCGGAADVMSEREDIEPVLKRFGRRVREGGPILTGISVSFTQGGVRDLAPAWIPDLYGGQPLTVLARFEGTGASTLVVTATTADGRPYRQEIAIELPAEARDAEGLPRLWAKHRIEALVDRLAREPNEATAIEREGLGLALAHGLVSPWTSLIAEDDQILGEAARTRRVVVASNEPAPTAPASPAAGFAAPPGLPMPAPMLGAFGAPQSAPPGARSAPAVVSRMAAAPAAASPSRFSLDSAYGPARETDTSEGGLSETVSGAASDIGEGGPPGRAKAKRGLLGALFGRRESPTKEPSPHTTPAPSPVPPIPTSYPHRTDALTPLPPLPLPTGSSGAPPSAGGPPEGFPRPPGARWPESALFQGDPIRAAQNRGIFLEPPGSASYPEQELRYLRERASGELDLVFLVDETGSMGQYIEQVKVRLLELVQALRRSPLMKSLRLGLVTYRDHPPQDDTYPSRSVELTDDIVKIEREVRSMKAQGGGDVPESVTDGLFDVVRLSWRTSAAKVVVWFGDAPPHGLAPNGGDGFPDGCPCGNHWYTQAESCREMGVAIYSVGCLPALRNFPGAEEMFRLVAKTTRGTYLPLTRAELLVPLIAGAAATELDKQRIDERVSDALAQHRVMLERTDLVERVRWLTELLRSEGVHPREMRWTEGQVEAAPLCFRPLEPPDVEASLARLRMADRAS